MLAAVSTIDTADNIERALRGRRRRTVNDRLPREVAETVRADGNGAPTKAVETQMHTSHRNATRWITAARERGFLTQEED
jgi:hypothetical protein